MGSDLAVTLGWLSPLCSIKVLKVEDYCIWFIFLKHNSFFWKLLGNFYLLDLQFQENCTIPLSQFLK